VTHLRVGITADPYLPVPPRLYGGIERIIDLLVTGLHDRGHEVVLFAHPGSGAAANRLVPYGLPPHDGRYRRACELVQLGSALLARRTSLDVVHSFGRLAALTPVLPMRSLPKIQSYQRPVPWTGVRRAVALAGDSITFTGCSASLFSRAGSLRTGDWRCIYNAVDTTRYCFVPHVPADAPLVYLGKIERMKGVHLAIDVAAAASRRLIIAGNRGDSEEDARYFTECIAPRLEPGLVDYIGPVDDRGKNDVLGAAAALIFPTLYDEAFGIVMAEAMACGTPVIGWANGSVPEVIADGVTGFVCRSVEEATAASARIGTISRAQVRRECEARFSADVIVDQYEALYHEVSRG
jgi:glycosyltransferase involved in cell wall biosynthesis